LFGVMMLLILIYRPQGILREKPILTQPIKKVSELRKKSMKTVT
jgi:branched-chain amino acid transport system permease protein